MFHGDKGTFNLTNYSHVVPLALVARTPRRLREHSHATPPPAATLHALTITMPSGADGSSGGGGDTDRENTCVFYTCRLPCR